MPISASAWSVEIIRAPRAWSSSIVFFPSAASSVSIASFTMDTLRPRSSRPFAAHRTQYSVTTPKMMYSASAPNRSTSSLVCGLSKTFERLFLDHDLRRVENIVWQRPPRIIRNRARIRSQSFRNDLRSRRSAQAVRRESREFGVAFRMRVAARHEKYSCVGGPANEALDIGNNLLRARDVKFASGQHEIRLSVHFPEDDFRSCHEIDLQRPATLF